VSVNTTSLGASVSTNSHAFCLQIIDSSLHSSIGLLTTCNLYKTSRGRTHLEINFSPDATYGQSLPNTIILNNLQTNNGCSIGIPTTYRILDQPFDSPELVFSQTSFNISA